MPVFIIPLRYVFFLWQVFLGRLAEGLHIVLTTSTKCLTHRDDKISAAGYRCDSLGVEMGHNLRRTLHHCIACTELTGVVFTPTVQEASLCEGNAEAISDYNLVYFTSDLLNAMWCQELAERSRSPEEKAFRLFRNGCAEASS